MLFRAAHPKLTSKFLPQSQPPLPRSNFITMYQKDERGVCKFSEVYFLLLWPSKCGVLHHTPHILIFLLQLKSTS
jgi:hypothetical protein